MVNDRELQRLFEKISDCYAGSVGVGCVHREEDRNERMVLSFFNGQTSTPRTVELAIHPATICENLRYKLVAVYDMIDGLPGDPIYVSNYASAVIAVALRK